MVNVVIRTAINSTETVMSNKTFDKITKQFELYKINDIIIKDQVLFTEQGPMREII